MPQRIAHGVQSDGLADILERVLDKGLVIAGDIKIKLCDVELLTIQIRLLVASVDKAQEMGLTWWWQEPSAPALNRSKALPGLPAPLPQLAPMARTPWEQYRQFQEFEQFQRLQQSAEGGERVAARNTSS